MRRRGLLGFLFSMLIPFPFLIYVDLIQKKRYHKMYAILFAISLINFILWSTLHFTGIFSFQKAIFYIDSVLAAMSLCFTVTFIKDMRTRQIKTYQYTAFGFLAFAISSLLEITLLITNKNNSNMISMIAGILSLLIMVIIQQIHDTMKEMTTLKLKMLCISPGC